MKYIQHLRKETRTNETNLKYRNHIRHFSQCFYKHLIIKYNSKLLNQMMRSENTQIQGDNIKRLRVEILKLFFMEITIWVLISNKSKHLNRIMRSKLDYY